MTLPILDGSGLFFQMTCRVKEQDYQIALTKCEAEKMTQLELMRTALKQYLQDQKQQTPQLHKAY